MKQLELLTEAEIRLLNTKVSVFDQDGAELTEGVHYTKDGYKVTPMPGIKIYKERFEKI